MLSKCLRPGSVLVLWTLTLAASECDDGVPWSPGLTLSHFSLHRPFTYIKERYGPYAAGAYFILKLGGAVKYEGKSVWGGGGEAEPQA